MEKRRFMIFESEEFNVPKIYISPAAHEIDHPCTYSASCGENIHANLYADELTPYLTACGFEWKRASKENRGQKIRLSVVESNEWGADLHYTIHTNASNGTVMGSRPMVWPAGKGREWAETILRYRRQIYPYPCAVHERTDLYELNSTIAVAVYEELVFHDNLTDVTWLHQHFRQLAAYTVRAFCEIFDRTFVDPYAEREIGDVNGDGKVDTSDARIVLEAAVGKTVLNDAQRMAADVNGDGKADTTDARLILQEAVERIDKLPTEQ